MRLEDNEISEEKGPQDRPIVEPTDEQMKAIKFLERALKKCQKAGVLFHNCYSNLIAYNGRVVSDVTDTRSNPDEIHCSDDGYWVENTYDLDMWSDDTHYIHYKNVRR